MKPSVLSLSCLLALAASGLQAEESASVWYENGRASAQQGAEMSVSQQPAKNVILFIGDGMGVSTVTAARILDGQLRGQKGEENALSFEQFPHLSLSKTYSVDGQTPDSAPTMTAMVSGIKTKQGVIGLTQNATYNDCASADGEAVATFLELAEAAGMSTGVISTARITHATPAATYAHTPNRDWEADSSLSNEARSNGCVDIARQLIEFPFGDGIEVALGGGREYFRPNNVADPEDSGRHGRRADGRDLTQEWTQRLPNSAFVWNKSQFDAINPDATDHLLGLFERSHMEYEFDRPNDSGGEPSIAEMTGKAIDILQKNPNGYFLMVEGGRVDHAHHAGNAYRALTDTIALAKAVQTAVDKTSANDTLIIVSADHSHVMTIAGYADRGNDILGKVVTDGSTQLDKNGKAYTTLSYANGPGFRGIADRPDLNGTATDDPNYLQEATVPLDSETHAAEDVAIYARGPGAHAFQGVVEQNVIYHVMAQSSRKVRSLLCILRGGCDKAMNSDRYYGPFAPEELLGVTPQGDKLARH
ncbi:alkaline phosphatase [Pseudomarimonas arenosa]|uniref:Alkaline phosphatase n=1 Tax=Pseudomarimonas arenosa TaxID=2774145 RepID=A0AAW3ZU46_9GAMM|nr:alkaline phosphatase [Pseudomarimonas arenosa]MBD8527606.1 alkaline phosphatase [Pseudomarimonas arenosa]